MLSTKILCITTPKFKMKMLRSNVRMLNRNRLTSIITSHSSQVTWLRSTEQVLEPSWKMICRATWIIKRRRMFPLVKVEMCSPKPTIPPVWKVEVSTHQVADQELWSNCLILTMWSHKITSESCKTQTLWRVLLSRKHWRDMRTT